jgi:hypothetical protein
LKNENTTVSHAATVQRPTTNVAANAHGAHCSLRIRKLCGGACFTLIPISYKVSTSIIKMMPHAMDGH